MNSLTATAKTVNLVWRHGLDNTIIAKKRAITRNKYHARDELSHLREVPETLWEEETLQLGIEPSEERGSGESALGGCAGDCSTALRTTSYFFEETAVPGYYRRLHRRRSKVTTTTSLVPNVSSVIYDRRRDTLDLQSRERGVAYYAGALQHGT